ncbi:MAG: TetR/AcrR family transcriptional regulator [Ornithinimicrobium sp.]
MPAPSPSSGETSASSRKRVYYAGDLRRDLLDAALVAATESGPSHVSLRDLARRLGVSHAAPKNHFADKRALFTALAAEAHQGLADSMDDAMRRADAEDPVQRLLAAGRAYLHFARQNPGYFTVMWQEDLHDRTDTALLAASERTFGSLLALAGEVTTSPRNGALEGQDPVAVALLAWTLVHGLADLSAGGALDDVPGPHDPHQWDEVLLGFVQGLLNGRGEPRP